MLFELAQRCIKKEFSKKQQSGILFLSVSTLDKVGHYFGQNSIEYLDVLYHLDQELGHFIDTVECTVKPEKIMWILTSDHGSMPPVEKLQEQGYSNARRINKNELHLNLNRLLEKQYGIQHAISAIDTPDIYLNHPVVDRLEKKTKKALLSSIKNYLLQLPGIKKVWFASELADNNYLSDTFENYFKNQYFSKRSADLAGQVFPYTLVSKNLKGSSHKTPYWYDTQVPLVIYQKNRFEKQRINKPVWITQVASTVAQILNIPRPSCTTFEVLPGIFT